MKTTLYVLFLTASVAGASATSAATSFHCDDRKGNPLVFGNIQSTDDGRIYSDLHARMGLQSKYLAVGESDESVLTGKWFGMSLRYNVEEGAYWIIETEYKDGAYRGTITIGAEESSQKIQGYCIID